MAGTNTKLTAAVEAYFADLGRVRASGGATGERSSYGPLANLLNAVGAAIKPKVFCVGELADQGAGHPDFGLYAAKQVRRGRPREGQIPEHGVVEVKASDDDAWTTAAGEQVGRYWGRYQLVLVTNTRDFVLVGDDATGHPAKLETFRLAASADDFGRKLERPHAFAREVGTGLGEYLARALSHRAALAEPKDLAWLLASYARDGLARVEAAGDPPALATVRSALEEALGLPLRGRAGREFLPFDAGADVVLRRFLRVGPMGAAESVSARRLRLAHCGLAPAGAGARGPVPATIPAWTAATARPC